MSATDSIPTSSIPTRSIRDLPRPRGLPLLGSGLQMLPMSRAHLQAEAWCERYGPIFQFRVGRRP
jgi:hypothetical protein